VPAVLVAVVLAPLVVAVPAAVDSAADPEVLAGPVDTAVILAGLAVDTAVDLAGPEGRVAGIAPGPVDLEAVDSALGPVALVVLGPVVVLVLVGELRGPADPVAALRAVPVDPGTRVLRGTTGRGTGATSDPSRSGIPAGMTRVLPSATRSAVSSADGTTAARVGTTGPPPTATTAALRAATTAVAPAGKTAEHPVAKTVVRPVASTAAVPVGKTAEPRAAMTVAHPAAMTVAAPAGRTGGPRAAMTVGHPVVMTAAMIVVRRVGRTVERRVATTVAVPAETTGGLLAGTTVEVRGGGVRRGGMSGVPAVMIGAGRGAMTVGRLGGMIGVLLGVGLRGGMIGVRLGGTIGRPGSVVVSGLDRVGMTA
jgi:hypothetical protein